MSYKKAVVVNCKKASIRKIPWIPIQDDLVVKEIGRGKIVDVDTSQISYDWTGRKFYRTRHPRGWIHEGVISLAKEG